MIALELTKASNCDKISTAVSCLQEKGNAPVATNVIVGGELIIYVLNLGKVTRTSNYKLEPY